MNLLRTDTYEVVRASRPTPRYAILSHRWEPEEITFDTMRKMKSSGLRSSSLSSIPASLQASAAKLRGACAIAQQQGFGYIWIDTCCIDKTKSEELRYALNMMFKWYQNAAVCYTYFNDVVFSTPNEKMFMSDRPNRRGQASEWFERGWTLQELIAPHQMQFYDKRWKFMGTRSELANLVGRVTGIDPQYMSGKRELSDASCAMKMSWMAGRVTQQVEDIAYSLIGLFDVHLDPIYGEGTRAFVRLQEAIMAEFGRFDESLFAWKRPQDSKLRCYMNEPYAHSFEHTKWGLLAPSPDCFKRSGDIFVPEKVEIRSAGGFRRSHQGIFFTMPSKEFLKRTE
ncbi:HET-domain-containing protein [Lizonia empirigonia]|nr:HET-domain-containing protein [Lizonia empirigonia]